MPVVWDAEANAKLVAAVMKVCEVKVGAKQMAEIAALIHPGESDRTQLLTPSLTSPRRLT